MIALVSSLREESNLSKFLIRALSRSDRWGMVIGSIKNVVSSMEIFGFGFKARLFADLSYDYGGTITLKVLGKAKDFNIYISTLISIKLSRILN